MRKSIVFVAALLGLNSTYSQDLPQWVLQLSRIKRHMRTELVRLPNFACQETVNRLEKLVAQPVFRPVDTLRLEVAVVGGKELYTQAGAGPFQDAPMSAYTSTGAFGTGLFSVDAVNIFVNDNSRTTGWEEEHAGDRKLLRYDFEIPQMASGFHLKKMGNEATVGIRGKFWADAETLDVLRIEEHGVDIPAALDMREVTTILNYGRTRIGAADTLLPRSATMTITNWAGDERRNVVEFTGCREYGSDSVIRFDTPDTPPAAPKKQ